MKIGILTHPLSWNYGGILQAYALQTYLAGMGHEVRVIALQTRIPVWRIPLGIMKRLLQKYIQGKNVTVFLDSEEKQTNILFRNTLEFVDNHIHLTEPLYSFGDLVRVEREYRPDVIVVGSDQVWRPKYVTSIYRYFLDFLPVNSCVKRLAYAASFGVDEWEYTSRQTRKCKKLLERFSAVSVREDSGVELCRRYLNREAIHVLDPTMLLLKEDYVSLITSADESLDQGGVFVYLLDETEDKQRVIDKVVESYQLPVWKTNMSSVIPPISDWLEKFEKAKFVVTDSFHGCVFSILFNKPFVVYGNNKRGMARFISLLRMFELEKRLIYTSEELQENNPEDICWEKVNQILEQQRSIAAEFLDKNL